MVAKLDDNTQFGRVADAAGNSPIGAAPADDGLAPLLDSHGRLLVVPYTGGPAPSTPISRADSGALTTFLLVKASPGTLYQAWGSQVSGVALWLQIYDLAVAPPAGAPYAAPIPVLNNGVWSLVFPQGLAFTTGILLALSTTMPNYTAPGPVCGWFTGLYR